METEIQIPFLNRAGEFDPNAAFQLVPKGSFPIERKEKDGTVRTYVQVVDDVSIEKMNTAFKNRVAANPAYKMLVDFEHFSHDTSKSSEAACWVEQTEVRADGLWSTKHEWSDSGVLAIKNRRYRYLSPVWFPRQTEKLAEGRVRPIQLNDAGLTNKPNMGEALEPFWNRADDFHGREAKPETKDSHMKDRLILICGLAAAATDEQIVAAVEGFKNRASQFDTTKSQLDTLNADNTALKNRFDTMLKQSVDRTLEEFKGVITEEGKDAWKNRLTSDFDGTVALLNSIKPASAKVKPVHKPAKGAAAAAVAHSETEAGLEDPFANRVKEVMAERKISEAEAQLIVCGESEEMYAAYRNRLGNEDAD